MQLFCALIDDLESELAAAGVRGVQFIVNSESQQVRNLNFADDALQRLVNFRRNTKNHQYNHVKMRGENITYKSQLRVEI